MTLASAPDVRRHESGLCTQEVTGPEARTRIVNRIPLPPMCPISGNPQEGSTLELSYRPNGWCLEVYSLAQVAARFAGGWRGTDRYPAERNMEGAVRLLVQMASHALGVRVRGRADLVLDAGRMLLTVRAQP